MNDSKEREWNNDIAIIGMNGRFPGAENTEKFWENLYNGVESVRFFEREELLEMGIDEHLLDNPGFVPADAILDDMDKFDAEFFDYSAREAEIMDPQHRLFLEAAWEVMEQAGYCADSYDGKIAVYGGANLSGYMIRNLYSNPGLVEKIGTFKIMLANGQDFLSTKVSYKMNFTGPSVNVNTLCSSSLVALHYACQELLNYGSDVALAGGVSFQVSRNEAFFYQEGGIGSADGHCRAFDEKANGTVSGSGLAMVVLKRMEDALRDGDQIYGVIKGTGINNDGAVKNSYTAPNVDGQAECIAQALAMAEVNPETISYVEAHGTGTNLGDPIEIAALTKAFRAYTDKKQFCAIGSVKTNIGHLVNAGGMASLIKTVLALEHEVIPASLNFEEPNHKIDFENSPFYVNTSRKEWKRSRDGVRRAGISSFGIGGTNVHAIVEEAPLLNPSEKSNRPCQILCLSAKTETALKKMRDNLRAFLEKNENVNLADMAFTLQVGRRRFQYKKVFVAADRKEALRLLEENTEKGIYSDKKKNADKKAVIKMTGEKDFEEMKDLLRKTESAFEKAYSSCGEIHNEKQGCFAFYYSFLCLLKSFGIEMAGFIAEGTAVYAAAAAEGTVAPPEIMAYLETGEQERKPDIDRKQVNVMLEEEVREKEEYHIMPVAFSYEEMLGELAVYWMEWGNVDWTAFYESAGEKRRRIKLPTYPFERKRYWIEPGKGKDAGEEKNPGLTKMPRPGLDTPYVAPRDEVEKEIAQKWEEVLGIEGIGIRDNFFALGGHSLIAAAVASELEKKFLVQIPMRTLFEASTIEEIAELVKNYRWAKGEGNTEDMVESGSI